jgi:hypothetical protein
MYYSTPCYILVTPTKPARGRFIQRHIIFLEPSMPYSIFRHALLLLPLLLLVHCQSDKKENQTTGTPSSQGKSDLLVCSFNIQFLGNPKARLDTALAQVVRACDIVAVQELVAPPKPGKFPDGSPFKPDKEAAEFFAAMRGQDYHYVMSEEDTGTNERIHVNSSGTEWWVTFYRPDAVQPATDLPAGFLAQDRSNHPDYERVPYAFPFRTLEAVSTLS